MAAPNLQVLHLPFSLPLSFSIVKILISMNMHSENASMEPSLSTGDGRQGIKCICFPFAPSVGSSDVAKATQKVAAGSGEAPVVKVTLYLIANSAMHLYIVLSLQFTLMDPSLPPDDIPQINYLYPRLYINLCSPGKLRLRHHEQF